MYMLYIDNIQFPVAPGRIVTEMETDNKMHSMVDGRWINALGGRCLKKFAFELLLPMQKYPFAQYDAGFCDAEYYLEKLYEMASENKAVDFELYKKHPGASVTYLTSMKVVFEKMEVKESAENGGDVVVSLVLREYRSVESKVVTGNTSTYEEREIDYTPPKAYIVQDGDNLWYISKKFLGDGARYKYLADINGIKKPYTIYRGQEIRLGE